MAVESLPARRCHTATARRPPPSRYSHNALWCRRGFHALGSVTSGILPPVRALRLLQALVQLLLLAHRHHPRLRSGPLVDPAPPGHRLAAAHVYAAAALAARAIPHHSHAQGGVILAVAVAPAAGLHVELTLHRRPPV